MLKQVLPQTVTARLRSNELQLLNDTGLSVSGDENVLLQVI